ncbi:alpha/beta hydrolase [Streptomyces spiralis]|uniref:alpha/beta hydrolase n=1 Tax=Streptomyces spiralis TaxID=66376 RepID=UPI0033F454A0
MTLDPLARQIMEQLAPPFRPIGNEVLDAREARRMLAAAWTPPSAPPEPVAEVREFTVPLPGEDSGLRLRAYWPERRGDCGPADTTVQALPAALFLHGGGWVFGNLDGSDALCRRLANEAQAVVVSVHYRQPPKHRYPAAAEDSFTALQWVVANAALLGVDPQRLAVVGESSGGNLAAATTLTARDRGGPSIAFQLLIQPVIGPLMDTESWRWYGQGYLWTADAMRWCWEQYLGTADFAVRVTDPRAAPLLADDLSGLPPAYIVTAECDPLRDEGEAYGRLLHRAGVPVTTVRHPAMFHGFFTFWDALPTARRASQEAFTAVREALHAADDASTPRP